MNRMILVPALLLSGIALAQTPPPTSGTPTTPSSPPARPATPVTPPVSKPMFKDLDKNQDGALDKTELLSISDLSQNFSTYDKDANGKLTESEYSVWVSKPMAIPVFEDLDVNKDASLDKTEVAKQADILRDFTTIDADKNGKVTKTEYTAWVQKQKQM